MCGGIVVSVFVVVGVGGMVFGMRSFEWLLSVFVVVVCFCVVLVFFGSFWFMFVFIG